MRRVVVPLRQRGELREERFVVLNVKRDAEELRAIDLLPELGRRRRACGSGRSSAHIIARMFKIEELFAREILDSRGNPTIEVDACWSRARSDARPFRRARPPARARLSSFATATRSATSARA